MVAEMVVDHHHHLMLKMELQIQVVEVVEMDLIQVNLLQKQEAQVVVV